MVKKKQTKKKSLTSMMKTLRKAQSKKKFTASATKVQTLRGRTKII